MWTVTAKYHQSMATKHCSTCSRHKHNQLIRLRLVSYLEPILAQPPPTIPPAWMKGPSFPAISPPAMDKVTLNIFTTKVFRLSRPGNILVW